jgi:transposase
MDAVSCQGCCERDARIAELEAKILKLEVDSRVAELQAKIRELEGDPRIAKLEAKIVELEGKLRDLNDKLRPPQPPQGPPKLPPGPEKKATGRKPGGQPGHPPHLKQFVPAERLKETIRFVPKHCEHCQANLSDEPGPDDPLPTRHQVAELPKVAAEITEYQGHSRTCACCGKVTRASIPAEITAHSVGPNFTATMSYLSGCHGMSKRAVEEVAEAVFDAPVGLGTVANLEQEVSEALVTAHQEALDAIKEAEVKHVDETGWKENGKKRWLWTAATASVVAFIIHPHRNLTALKRIVGETLAGILCSDRWRVYDNWTLLQRQICWAHLKRNWEKLVERGGTAKKIGEGCLNIQRQVFELWHRFRGGGCTRAELDDFMVPLVFELREVLQTGRRSRDCKLVRFCTRLLDVYPALWTFVIEEGVEPTNNHAERVQRRAVLWRRRSFGCHSADGCRFVERILTVVQTLRLQRRPVLDFLQQTIRAQRQGLALPKLICQG